MGVLVTRAALLVETREWVGTPVIWQQSAKGLATDCKGLVAGVARELGLEEAQSLAARIRTYGKGFDPDDLVRGLDDTLIRTTTPGPADVAGLLMGFPREGPRHLAILSDRPGWVIHAYGGGFGSVAEVPIAGTRKVWGYWTWPSLVLEDRLGR